MLPSQASAPTLSKLSNFPEGTDGGEQESSKAEDQASGWPRGTCHGQTHQGKRFGETDRERGGTVPTVVSPG